MAQRNRIIFKRLMLIQLSVLLIHVLAVLIYCFTADVNKLPVWIFLTALTLVLFLADLIACAKAINVKERFEEPYDAFELVENDGDADGAEEQFKLEVHDVKQPSYEGSCLIAKDDPFLYYLIDKENYIIGSDEKLVDCVLDSKYVSPYHAFIITSDKGMYVQDIASDNGTYVNGRQIPSGSPYTIHDGDDVQFANMKYILHIKNSDNREEPQNEEEN